MMGTPGSSTSRRTVRADRGRLRADFDALAAIGRLPSGGLMREAYTLAFLEARALIQRRMEAAGLMTRIDAAGNLLGRTLGPLGPVVLTGSHLDAVPNGGTFDGAAGVVAGLEAVRAIVESGLPLRRGLEVVGFVEEEGRFTGLLGSLAMVGEAPLDRLTSLRDAAGVSFRDALADCGLSVDHFGEAARRPDEVAAFVELHVEQGAVLEQSGLPLGVVTAIAGTHRLAVEIIGRADHAGSTPMDMRQDALLAAAEVVVAARSAAVQSGRATARATVGQLFVEPNVTSAVAERVRFVVDVRDVDGEARAGVVHRIEKAIAAACARERLGFSIKVPYSAIPCPTDPAIRAEITAACRTLDVPFLKLPSGASHDAQNLARLAPTGMIFVPSRDGRSHSPAEHTDPEDLARGTDILIETLLRLAAT